MQPVTAPARLVAASALALVVLAAGCGGDDGGAEAERAGLAESLGFLRTDFGLSDEEVDCAARTIQDRLGDGVDLDAFADQVHRVDEGDIAIADLPADDAAVLTESLTTCSGSS